MSGGEGEALRRSKKREHDTGKNPKNRAATLKAMRTSMRIEQVAIRE